MQGFSTWRLLSTKCDWFCSADSWQSFHFTLGKKVNKYVNVNQNKDNMNLAYS